MRSTQSDHCSQTLSANVAETLAGGGRLFAGTLIDSIVIIALSIVLFPVLKGTWSEISGVAVEAPIIGFMSDYSRPAQNGYWLIVLLSILVAVLLNAAAAKVLGASIGKAAVGVRLVTFSGQRPSIWPLLKKSLFNIGLFLLAALPGPILGFLIGSSADWISIACLVSAAAFAAYVGFVPGRSGLFAAYYWAGIAPVVRRRFKP